MRVRVKVSCEPVRYVLEALHFIQQEDAYGEGFLHSVVCDGRTHESMEVVEALDGTLHPGRTS